MIFYLEKKSVAGASTLLTKLDCQKLGDQNTSSFVIKYNIIHQDGSPGKGHHHQEHFIEVYYIKKVNFQEKVVATVVKYTLIYCDCTPCPLGIDAPA